VETKKVYLEPAWKLHMGYHVRQMMPFPPEGYEFITRNGLDERVSSRISGFPLTQQAIAWLWMHLPVPLIKARWDGVSKRPPPDSVLTFASNHLVFRKEPWVADIGRIWEVIGYNLKHFRRYQRRVEEAFADDNCKAVLCWTEFSRNTCLNTLDCRDFKNKLDTIPLAVAPQNFIKKFDDNVIRMFFIGSANLAGQFELRGGKEVLEAFGILSKKYKNIELIVRSDISPEIKKRYARELANARVKIIDGLLPWTECYPGHKWKNSTRPAISFSFPAITSPGR
jgi:hypothetical protein